MKLDDHRRQLTVTEALAELEKYLLERRRRDEDQVAEDALTYLRSAARGVLRRTVAKLDKHSPAG